MSSSFVHGRGRLATAARTAFTAAGFTPASVLSAGGKVTMRWLPGVNHGFAGAKSADAAVAWMMDRFAGRPAPSDCGKATTVASDAEPSAQ